MLNTIEREPMLQEHVLKTTDYHLFSFISGNRKVNMAHARRLEKSFSKRQLLSPIIVNEHYQIIDGQHRYTVCKKLSLPIYYLVVEGYGLDEVQILNTNSSNWKKTDYLNAYCDLRYPEYLKFRRFMQQYQDFGFQACEMLLSHKTMSRKGESKKEFVTETNSRGYVGFRTFEEGEFTCVNYEKSCEMADNIMMIKQIAPTVLNRKAFIAALIQLFRNENFDWSEFMNKLQQQPLALVECVNVTQYKSLIEEIYNWKRKNKVNLRY
jgi:hypothetical protein